MQRKYMLGFSYEPEGEFYVPYSDIEKTFIDMVMFRQKMGKEIIEKLRKDVNKKKLAAYLKIYPERIRVSVKKALGFNPPKAI